MKLLLIKTSSLGDVIHALPAVTEALARIDGLEITWVVEEAFADIPRMHPGVTRVIPVAIRRWRQDWWQHRSEIRSAIGQIRDTGYDCVLDSQGLIKSAVLTVLARGLTSGYDRQSAREPLASLAYQNRFAIDNGSHAVLRQKQLFAASLGYQFSPTVDYGLETSNEQNGQIVFLHGTTWPSKEWPLENWQKLSELTQSNGYDVVVPAGNQNELENAAMILSRGRGRILDRLPLRELAAQIASSSGVVSVDTGLGHLAAACNVPVVGLFGSTDPGLTAMSGAEVELIVSDHLPCIPCKKRTCEFPKSQDSSSIYPPCFERTTPESVWQALQLRIGSKDTGPG